MKWLTKIFTLMLISQIIIYSQVLNTNQETYSKQKLDKQTMTNEKSNLVILWTSGDPEVALKMVFMYAKGAMKNNWWKSINLIIWGPSSKLTSENEKIQSEIKEMQKLGIIVEACKACADEYGVSSKLEELGITVKYMGKPLTDFLKSDAKVVTF